MTELKPFVTPHCHVQSIDSGSTVEAFVEREKELNTGVLVCSDHGTLQATRKVYDLAKKNKLIPVLGFEGYMRPSQCSILEEAGIPKTINDKFPELGPSYIDYMKYMHFTMHFLDADAFETASRLLSKANVNAERHGSERKPIFGWDELEELGSKQVTVGTGCLIGMVQRHLLENRPDIAEKYYLKLKSLVKPGNLLVEVFPHKTDKNWVSAVFLRNTNTKAEQRFPVTKRLRIVDIKGRVFEGEAGDLVKKFAGASMKLVAKMHFRKWNDLEPFDFNQMEIVNGFVQNECAPFAPNGDSQLGANKFMLELAKKYNDPVFISDDSHYAHPEEKIVQDIKLLQDGWKIFYSSYHRQSSQEAYNYFSTEMGIGTSEIEGWIENSRNWANRFKDFAFKKHEALPSNFYPSDTVKYTYDLINKYGRMNWDNKVYVDRLNREIELFHNNGTVDLLPYFFVKEEAMEQYTLAKELVGPGRGSSCGTILAYLFNITNVDPIKWDLSLERFLTLDRIQSGNYPDIDSDLPNRDILVPWLDKRFGDHYAQISTETTMKVKSSIKDVFRALHGSVPFEIEQTTGKMGNPPQGISDKDYVFGYEADGAHIPGALEKDQVLIDFTIKYPEEWKIVCKCLGLNRSAGKHPSAFLIAPEPLQNFLPMTVTKDVRVTEYNGASVEAAGGIKFDWLCVNVLKDVSGAIKLIQERNANKYDFTKDFTINNKKVPGFRAIPTPNGNIVDIWDLPEEEVVFNDICEGKTETVFQFDTSGVLKWLKNFNVVGPDGKKLINSIEDMAIFTALDRPGPLDAEIGTGSQKRNMLEEFASRKAGGSPIDYIPELGELLPETRGIIVMQEQLTKVYKTIGKTTGTEAELFRRHVSKKKMAEVIKDKERFMKGALETLSKERAEEIFQQIQTFARYGFCRSHSVAYCHTSYACAYLKHFYPLEWWTAVLTNATREEVNSKFWKSCGHLILTPDIKHSKSTFVIEGDKIRAPLWLLEGIGDGAHEQLNKLAPYDTVKDFVEKIEKDCIARGKETVTTKEKVVKIKGTKQTETITVEVKKFTKGRSAINKRVMNTLIVSGAADGLFEPGMDMLTKLQTYERVKSEVTGKKQNPIDAKFLTFDAITRFQYRKQLLPGLTTSLLPILFDSQVEGITKGESKGMYIYQGTYPFVNNKYVQFLNNMTTLTQKQTMYLAAYVVKDRRFKFHTSKNAAELILDVAGVQEKYVKWPPFNGSNLPPEFKDDLTGAIILAKVTKSRMDKPPAVDSIVIVKAPLQDTDEDKE
jgi:DNA-directed DNA polymerase III PolC